MSLERKIRINVSMQRDRSRVLNLVMLNVLKLFLVSLSVGSTSLLVKDLLDLARIDEIIDLITGLPPIALSGALFFDIVRGFTEIARVGEVFWIWSSFVLGPFVSSGHDVLIVYM